MIPVELLKIEPQHAVLDMCAVINPDDIVD